MASCKTLNRLSLSSLHPTLRTTLSSFSLHTNLSLSNSTLSPLTLSLHRKTFPSRSFASSQTVLSLEAIDDSLSRNDTVEELLTNNKDDVTKLMKMERRSNFSNTEKKWFPYLNKFKCGNDYLNSSEILEALDPYILDLRKERFRNAVRNRSYSVCLVVEGLSDFGNVSAAFRSADALGVQSVHVVSCDSSKRYRENRHVSMGAEKWLDIELWDSIQECFKVLKSRGYCIATTHIGVEAVSIYDMDWSSPTAIVVGNENRGISQEALELSDLHCSIPMKGMVDSFNVSVAAGILMHHAVCDRTSRMGSHGDLTLEESQILLAEFSLRHSNSAISIAHEYAKRKTDSPLSKL
ncbi:tRNA/rRNA methyltransferase, SpoU type [Dillenia turbinata]|uniref:tRNA/rRNA methyltransferase, SpoU type n=1 Tax=Dillenia turbinata TaxID=194707 RepID=A0AAN8Z6D2_9MAGN